MERKIEKKQKFKAPEIKQCTQTSAKPIKIESVS